MNRIEFAEGLKKNFGIRDSSPFIDVLLHQVTGHCTLDVIAFDEYLQKIYGQFPDGMSASDFIRKQFGEEAEAWTMKAIEVI